jgi:branched-chain amino acid aminotransferase
MDYFNYNGKLLEKNTPVLGPDNRSFRYGDGLFETLKYKNDAVIMEEEHLDRLWKGLQLMQYEPPSHFTREMLKEQVTQTIKKNKFEHARVRLAVFRGDGGIYDPVNHIPNYIIQCWPLVNPSNELNENGLHACIYHNAKKALDDFCNVKHNCYLPYYMGAMFAKKYRCNDAIILNQFNRPCDSTIANIFIVKNDEVITPSLDEGCIAGIMRETIIRTLKKSNLAVTEKAITQEELLDADEIFLTNSILNLKWIGRIGDKQFIAQKTKVIADTLSATNPAVFC